MSGLILQALNMGLNEPLTLNPYVKETGSMPPGALYAAHAHQ